jgi:HSP20 family protein
MPNGRCRMPACCRLARSEGNTNVLKHEHYTVEAIARRRDPHADNEPAAFQEPTTPTRAFLPTTDIFENEDALTLVLEMPGVDRDNINISVENGVLTVEGRINFSKYEGLQPVYSEYNIGPYRRTFSISSRIDQEEIRAEMRDGVITLVLPKAEQAKPRRIEVK